VQEPFDVRILITGERAVADYRESFAGIDIGMLKSAIAIAEACRDGEVRFVGEVEASPSPPVTCFPTRSLPSVDPANGDLYGETPFAFPWEVDHSS